jgi:hypothetical protein
VNGRTGNGSLPLAFLIVVKIYSNSTFVIITCSSKFSFICMVKLNNHCSCLEYYFHSYESRSVVFIYIFLDGSSLDLSNEDDKIILSKAQIIHSPSIVHERELDGKQEILWYE